MKTTKILNDSISLIDRQGSSAIHSHTPTLWNKTEIIGGYGVHTAANGISVLDETVLSSANMVTLGGVQLAMELIFGVKGPVTVPTLYTDAGIGLPDANVDTSKATIQTPEGTKVLPHNPGYNVVLFGVGVTGTAENSTTEIDVSYREKSINVNLTATDGTVLTGQILPFRYTDSTLTAAESLQYFGKKTFDNDVVGYYLKRFDSDPVIHHLWKTGEDSEDEPEVENSEVWTSNRTTPVESLTEKVLTLSIKDLKEFYTANDEVKKTRFNTIALFSAQYNPANGDYENVRMFSKLNIPVENLSLAKDLSFIYRVYGS